MSVISYILEEIFVTFTALSSIHTVLDFDVFHLSAVAGVTLLCALAGITAVTGLTGLIAFNTGTFTAVTGSSCDTINITGVCAVTGGVTAVAGVVHQLILF